jgi:hypothetical protein
MGPLFKQILIAGTLPQLKKEEENTQHLNRRFLLHIILCVHSCGKFFKINKSYNTIQNFGIKTYHIMPIYCSICLHSHANKSEKHITHKVYFDIVIVWLSRKIQGMDLAGWNLSFCIHCAAASANAITIQ